MQSALGFISQLADEWGEIGKSMWTRGKSYYFSE